MRTAADQPPAPVLSDERDPFNPTGDYTLTVYMNANHSHTVRLSRQELQAVVNQALNSYGIRPDDAAAIPF